MKNILDSINCPDDIKRLKPEEMSALAKEIRRFLIKNVSETGGHLASNLGVVELTLALAYCFDMPKDKIIWDVGHQSYVHKIITGRKDGFKTLRKLDGMSGFPEPSESKYDIFSTGHSSTSISSAMGIAAARDLKGESFKIAAVIGDGSMTGGLAYEGLNNVGRSGKNIMVILNDNQMSISKNVGAMSRHLNDMRTKPGYLKAKSSVHSFLDKIPVAGEKATQAIEKTKNLIKYIMVPSCIFEEMGFKYIGPVNGHDIEELTEVIGRARNFEGPVLIDVVTVKGKGINYAEKNPSLYHGIGRFDPATGEPLDKPKGDIFSKFAGKTLCDMAQKDKRIVAVTAAMADGTGLDGFAAKFPKRFFDVGIAEQHAVTFSAGMAKMGCIPVFAVYSTFLQRAYDQIIHDVCLQNLRVIFAVDRAGVVGPDGKTHQGIFDIAFMNHIPNITVMAPKDAGEVRDMFKIAAEHNGPSSIRYPKEICTESSEEPIAYGKARLYEDGEKIAVVTEGTMFFTGREVCEILKKRGLKPMLVNFPFIKPLDKDMIGRICTECGKIYVIEDGVITGGFGESLMYEASLISMAKVTCFGLPDKFIEHGTREEIFERYGLSSEAIAERIIKENGEENVR